MARMTNPCSGIDLTNGMVLIAGTTGQNTAQLDVYDYVGTLLESNLGTASTRIPASFTSAIAALNALKKPEASAMLNRPVLRHVRVMSQGQFLYLAGVLESANTTNDGSIGLTADYNPTGTVHYTYTLSNLKTYSLCVAGAWYSPLFKTMGNWAQDGLLQFTSTAGSGNSDWNFLHIAGGTLALTPFGGPNNTFLPCPRVPYIFNMFTGQQNNSTPAFIRGGQLNANQLPVIFNRAQYPNSTMGVPFCLDGIQDAGLWWQDETNPLFSENLSTTLKAGSAQISIPNPLQPPTVGSATLAVSSLYTWFTPLYAGSAFLMNQGVKPNNAMGLGMLTFANAPLGATTTVEYLDETTTFQPQLTKLNIPFGAGQPTIPFGANQPGDEGNLQMAMSNTSIYLMAGNANAVPPYSPYALNNNGLYPSGLNPGGFIGYNQVSVSIDSLNRILVVGQTRSVFLQVPTNVRYTYMSNNLAVAGHLVYPYQPYQRGSK